MITDREKIFSAIRAALAPLPERAANPEWDDSLIVSRPAGSYDSLKAQFVEKFTAVSGRFFDDVDSLVTFLRENKSTFGVCDPALTYLFDGIEDITLEDEFDLDQVNAYAFGVTKAACVIAESGTIVLKDSETKSRLSALAPWIHIAVVKEADVRSCIADAIKDFGEDPSVIFVTGPSKTADVEGILIEGVHGPGIQICLCL